MTVASLDRLPELEARDALTRCCGASRWVTAMLAARPFGDEVGLLAAARHAFATLGAGDWREAFEHHPRIGDLAALRQRFAATAAWAGAEQHGAAVATDVELEALARGNAAYEQRFDHRFIVCASGLTAVEMLARLEQRLTNGADAELEIAAGEQRKITELRLAKLLAEET